MSVSGVYIFNSTNMNKDENNIATSNTSRTM